MDDLVAYCIDDDELILPLGDLALEIDLELSLCFQCTCGAHVQQRLQLLVGLVGDLVAPPDACPGTVLEGGTSRIACQLTGIVDGLELVGGNDEAGCGDEAHPLHRCHHLVEPGQAGHRPR